MRRNNKYEYSYTIKYFEWKINKFFSQTQFLI